MIELRTGIPRHGKTLHMVDKLAQLLKRWDTHPEEARPVFCHKVYDLSLQHSDMPTLLWYPNPRDKEVSVEVPNWDAMPDGSIVLIDECDKIFPPRSSAAVPPPHVNWLTEHGHKGFDIWLTTQHPKFIDSKVRALTGKHQHFRRLFGGGRAMIYEWDACSDNLAGMKQSVKTLWNYPKKSFEYYKSASIHTKQNFKFPLWLLIPVLGAAMALFFVPRAFSVLSQGVSGKGVGSAPEILSSASKGASLPASGVQIAPTMAGAVAPVKEAQLLDFSKPFNDAPVAVERPVSKLRLAPGVYSDIPEDSQHYSDEELKIQARSARVLALMDEQKTYIATLAAAEFNQQIPVHFSVSVNGANPK